MIVGEADMVTAPKWDSGCQRGDSCFRLFPRHYRWRCRNAIVSALRSLPDEPMRAQHFVGVAWAHNSVMYDAGDPLAYRYAVRIQKIRDRLTSDFAGW